MSRKRKPVAERQWKRDQGKFEPVSVSEAQEFHLGQVTTPEAIAGRLAIADTYCQEAETWLEKNGGVAKSALRDALVRLAEVWLGKPAPEALALVRRFIAEQRDGMVPTIS
jgi:hypothetical protein